ncbi:MAG: T9SS C-terminal target domain-containing protein, partial [Bacteroidetes bacterium]
NTAFFWDFGEGATSTLANPVHIFPQGGDYRVALQVSSASGCSDASEDTVSVKYTLTSISAENAGQWKIYPNPAQNSLFLEPGRGVSGPVFISLWDLQGRKLFDRTELSGAQPIEVDLRGLAPGIYLLRYSSAQAEGQCMVSKNQAG